MGKQREEEKGEGGGCRKREWEQRGGKGEGMEGRGVGMDQGGVGKGIEKN